MSEKKGAIFKMKMMQHCAICSRILWLLSWEPRLLILRRWGVVKEPFQLPIHIYFTLYVVSGDRYPRSEASYFAEKSCLLCESIVQLTSTKCLRCRVQITTHGMFFNQAICTNWCVLAIFRRTYNLPGLIAWPPNYILLLPVFIELKSY